MYYDNFISQYGAKNIIGKDGIEGFEFEVNYPGMFCTGLSFYKSIKLWVDDKEIQDKIFISVDRYHYYALSDQRTDEMQIIWPFKERATVRVMKAGGLRGCHCLKAELEMKQPMPMGACIGERVLTFV